MLSTSAADLLTSHISPIHQGLPGVEEKCCRKFSTTVTCHLTDYTLSSCRCRYLGSKWKKPLDTLKCLNSSTAKLRAYLSISGAYLFSQLKTLRGGNLFSKKEERRTAWFNYEERRVVTKCFEGSTGPFRARCYGAKETEGRPICVQCSSSQQRHITYTTYLIGTVGHHGSLGLP